MIANDELRTRIEQESEDDLALHAAYQTGSADNFEYYLVLGRKRHEGKEMLKIRYFAAHEFDPAKDTWMKNGVTARQGDELIDRLAKDFQAFAAGVTGECGDFITHDLSGGDA